MVGIDLISVLFYLQ